MLEVTEKQEKDNFSANIGFKWRFLSPQKNETLKIRIKKYNDYRGIPELQPIVRIEISIKNNTTNIENYLLRRVYGQLISDNAQKDITSRLSGMKKINTRDIYNNMSNAFYNDRIMEPDAYPKKFLHFVDFHTQGSSPFLLEFSRDESAQVIPTELLASPENTMFFGRESSQFFLKKLLKTEDALYRMWFVKQELEKLLVLKPGVDPSFEKNKQLLPTFFTDFETALKDSTDENPESVLKALKILKKLHRESWLNILKLLYNRLPSYTINDLCNTYFKEIAERAQPHPGALFLSSDNLEKLL